MLNILKRQDKKEELKEVNNFETNTKESLDELLSQKKSIESELEELEDYKDKVKALLPFEKKDLLEKELELLKVKERIVLNKIEKERKKNGRSKDLDEICINIRDKIEAKREEILETGSTGRAIHLNHNGASLDRDPRIEIKKEIEKKKHYNIMADLLDKRLKIFKDLERNRRNLINHTQGENKIWYNYRYVAIKDDRIRHVKELKKEFTKKCNTDHQSQLDAINTELEEIRAELISRNEYSV